MSIDGKGGGLCEFHLRRHIARFVKIVDGHSKDFRKRLHIPGFHRRETSFVLTPERTTDPKSVCKTFLARSKCKPGTSHSAPDQATRIPDYSCFQPQPPCFFEAFSYLYRDILPYEP